MRTILRWIQWSWSRATLLSGDRVRGTRCLVLAAVALLACQRERRVYADLPNATGLREAAPVRFRGIDIGRVERIAFSDSVVHVTIAILRRDAPLRSGDRVRITPDGVFGDRALEIVPGPTSAPLLAKGATLGSAPLDSLAEIRQGLIEAAGRALFRDLGTVTRRDSTTVPPARKP